MPLPLQYHRLPLLEQIGSMIGRRHCIIDRMRKRAFRWVPRVRIHRCPVAERGAEAVGGGEAAGGVASDLLVAEELGQHHFGHRLA